jgi:hypothetical protein
MQRCRPRRASLTVDHQPIAATPRRHDGDTAATPNLGPFRHFCGADHEFACEFCNAVRMKVTRIKAAKVREGDKIVVTVARVMGVQGRKPRDSAPLLKLEYEDGTTELLREDQQVAVLR